MANAEDDEYSAYGGYDKFIKDWSEKQGPRRLSYSDSFHQAVQSMEEGAKYVFRNLSVTSQQVFDVLMTSAEETAIGNLANKLLDTAIGSKIHATGEFAAANNIYHLSSTGLKVAMETSKFATSFDKSGNYSPIIRSSAVFAGTLGDFARLYGDILKAQDAMIQISKTLDYIYYNSGKAHTVPLLTNYWTPIAVSASVTSIGNAGVTITSFIPGAGIFNAAAHGVAAFGEMSDNAIRTKILEDLGSFIEDDPNSEALTMQTQHAHIAINRFAKGHFAIFSRAVTNELSKEIQNTYDFIEKKKQALERKQKEWNSRSLALLQLMDKAGIHGHPSGITALVRARMEAEKISLVDAEKDIEADIQTQIFENNPLAALERLEQLLTVIPPQYLDLNFIFRDIINNYGILARKPVYVAQNASWDDCKMIASEIGLIEENVDTLARAYPIFRQAVVRASKEFNVKSTVDFTVAYDACETELST